MVRNRRPPCVILGTRPLRYVRLFLLIPLFLAATTACRILAGAQRHYENPEFGLSLDKPSGWKLETHTGGILPGPIVLTAGRAGSADGAALIEIWGAGCERQFGSKPEVSVQGTIDAMEVKYDLDGPPAMVAAPHTVENADKVVTRARAAIPTSALPDGHSQNMVGGQDPNRMQEIDVLAISDLQGKGFTALLYRGNNSELNLEAEAILDSIHLLCPSDS